MCGYVCAWYLSPERGGLLVDGGQQHGQPTRLGIPGHAQSPSFSRLSLLVGHSATAVNSYLLPW
jgi:hypothetical protein